MTWVARASRSRLAFVLALVALALLVSGVAPGGARAQGSDGSAAGAAQHLLDEGQRLYRELDFAGAVEALESALAVPGAPDAVRLSAYEYLGSAYVVLEHRQEARQAFRAMMQLDPYHVVHEPSGSPKIARFVANVRAEVVLDAALNPSVHLSLALPPAGRVGEATRVAVGVSGTPSVATVAVFVRGTGATGWTKLVAHPDGDRYVASVPPRPAADQLQIYAQARDGQGRVVARAGEPLLPLTLSIRGTAIAAPGGGASSGGSVFTRWWFWTGVAVVAVATGAVAFGLANNDGLPSGSLPPGRVDLP